MIIRRMPGGLDEYSAQHGGETTRPGRGRSRKRDDGGAVRGSGIAPFELCPAIDRSLEYGGRPCPGSIHEVTGTVWGSARAATLAVSNGPQSGPEPAASGQENHSAGNR